MTSVRETVEAILVSKFQVLPEELAADGTLASMDLDSLAVIELLYTLGKELDVKVGEDEVTSYQTLPQLVALLEDKRAPRAAQGVMP
ncbi:acyl carrier protein [Streptomyces sp. NPDC051173]|uniref:acyl carrier protein n=1 Tax=Streptomyces sp. NPDC051173 TaxID=3155164 RepID=UPI00344B37D7